MMPLQITPASITDIPELCSLLTYLFTQEQEFTSDTKAQERGLRSVITNPQIGHILVARQGGDIIAMVNLLYTISTALGERVALLEDMVVLATARGKGVGSALLGHALEFAKQQHCKRITLLTDPDNQEAHRFYQKNGFSQSQMVVFRLSIDPALAGNNTD
tara:strand:- start:1349 stop:1831 length:483 start_codon:yes stop_codon:yes gene_type:complete